MADHIDEFESMFRRAAREPFAYVEVPISRVTLIHDRPADHSEQLVEQLRAFLPRLSPEAQWRSYGQGTFSTVGELLERINSQQTDLIVTYRHLGEEQLVPQHSLGVYLDVLTQQTSIPVLVLPGTAQQPISLAGRECSRVMVVTDHISGDNRLINYGVRLCSSGGSVWLCHIEDNRVFERYMDTIERIPDIDSDQARTLIDQQLRKDAADFIQTCIHELQSTGPNLACHSVVQRGHHLTVFRQLVDDAQIDLLVTNTKDSDQLAMHGKAYSLSVEFVDVAMLLL